MTNEQREAIDRLKDDIKYADMRDTVDDDCTICFIDDLDTVLSLIKEQQAEMEDLKNKSVLIKRYFKKCDLIKQKDNQIDLMARAIDNYDSQLEINTFKDKEHIKQYFGELAEKEN